MDITPLVPKSQTHLTGYGAGGFKINNEQISGSRLVLLETHFDWPITEAQAITAESLQQLTSYLAELDIVLLGTGSRMQQVSEEVRAFFRAHNVALEVMDTGAACRTYNVLQSEARRVAAALIAV